MSDVHEQRTSAVTSASDRKLWYSLCFTGRLWQGVADEVVLVDTPRFDALVPAGDHRARRVGACWRRARAEPGDVLPGQLCPARVSRGHEKTLSERP